MKKPLLLLSLLMFFFVGELFALEAIRLEPGQSHYYLGEKTEYFLLEPEEDIEMTAQKALRFQPVNRRFLGFGPSKKSLWVRFRITNPTDQLRSMRLVMGRETLNCRLFLKEQGQLASLQDEEVPLFQPGARERLYLFDFEPGTKDLYAYCASKMYLGVKLLLADDEYFWQANVVHFVLLAAFYGGLLALWLYNLILAITLRERGYWYYLAAVASFSAIQSALDGSINVFTDDMIFAMRWAFWGLAGMGIFLPLFTRDLLGTKKIMPRLDRFIRYIVYICIAQVILVFFLPVKSLTIFSPIVGGIMPILLISAGVIAMKKAVQAAKYYLAAWSFYMIGILLYTFGFWGVDIWDLGIDTYVLMTKIGSILEAILLALALADRIHAERKAREIAQERALVAERQMTEELELQVMERTKELESANQTKDKFFSIISHELRGPIGGIATLFSEVIKAEEGIDEKLLDHIRRTMRNLHRLLEDLLEWSRSQSGQMDFTPKHFLLLEPISYGMDLLQNQANQKGVELLVEGDAKLCAYADPSMITTVIRNLLANAIKFTPKGGKVIVRLAEKGSEVLVEVIDSGVGMTEETRRSLFLIGQTAKSTLGTDKEKGSGLGLIFCKEFVEKNQGKIDVESHQGKGSRFWFTLPLSKGGIAMVEPSLVGVPLLVVEDDDIEYEVTANCLKEIGCDFLRATSGPHALELVRTKKFEFVLMDIDMPGMDGIEVTEVIRKQYWDGPKVIALTSFSKSDLGIKAKLFDSVLSKPLERSDLIDEVARIRG